MKFYYDSDGFFWPSDISEDYMRDERRCISFEKISGNYKDVFEQYYLGFRSALFICEDSIEDDNDEEKVDSILVEHRQACIGSALQYMEKHINSEKSLPVDYLWIIRDLVVNSVKDKYPDAENIKLKLLLEPRFSARVASEKTIVIPALLRTILIQCNLTIINSIYDFTNGFDWKNKDSFTGDLHQEENARYIFPYLLFCHDNLSVKYLPYIGVRSEEVLNDVLEFTNIQLLFILAHEYAHILLNHFNDSRDGKIKETEADSFAMDVLFSYVGNRYSKESLLAAVRWLFKYQLIEDRIGKLIQGEKITDFDSSYEERRGKCQIELLTKYDGGCSIYETIGFCMIVELQKILYDIGLEIINDILEAFNHYNETGDVKPWWKKIKK